MLSFLDIGIKQPFSCWYNLLGTWYVMGDIMINDELFPSFYNSQRSSKLAQCLAARQHTNKIAFKECKAQVVYNYDEYFVLPRKYFIIVLQGL